MPGIDSSYSIEDLADDRPHKRAKQAHFGTALRTIGNTNPVQTDLVAVGQYLEGKDDAASLSVSPRLKESNRSTQHTPRRQTRAATRGEISAKPTAAPPRQRTLLRYMTTPGTVSSGDGGEVDSSTSENTEQVDSQDTSITVTLEFDNELLLASRARNIAFNRHAGSLADSPPLLQAKIRQMEDFVSQTLSDPRPGRQAVLGANLLGALIALAADLGLKPPSNVSLNDAEGLIEEVFMIRTGTEAVLALSCLVDWEGSCELERLARDKIGHEILAGHSLIRLQYEMNTNMMDDRTAVLRFRQ